MTRGGLATALRGFSARWVRCNLPLSSAGRPLLRARSPVSRSRVHPLTTRQVLNSRAAIARGIRPHARSLCTETLLPASPVASTMWEVADSQASDLTASRARADELRAKGRVMADYLRTHPGCFIERAALAAGVNPRTYRRWIEHDGEDYRGFQDEVLPALLDHAEALLREAKADIESAEGGSNAWAGWHKWLLPKRHPKLFGEQPQEQRVELTGKDGGAVEHEMRVKGCEELITVMLAADAVKRGREDDIDE